MNKPEHAQDEAGRGEVIFRPDGELHATPEQAGWGPVSWQSQPNAAISYTTDTLRGKVTRIWTTDQTQARYIVLKATLDNLRLATLN